LYPLIIMNELKTFREIRSNNNYEAAISEYVTQLGDYYSLDSLRDLPPSKVSVATWFADKTEGVSMDGWNFALLMVGVLSVKENVNRVVFQTYHSVSTNGNFKRILQSGIAEGIGIIVGLLGLVILISCIVALFIPKIVEISWSVKMLWGLLGVAFLLLSRVALRYSKVLKVPKEIFRDQSSPFKLATLRTLEKDLANKAQ